MKKLLALVGVVAVSLVLAGCTPAPNEFVQTGAIAGFWRGLWHGLIAPITFVISLISHNVGIYEVHNNGNWYNFGFVIGILCHHGGTAAGCRRRKGGGA